MRQFGRVQKSVAARVIEGGAMDRDTKIVFIHEGKSWYLPYALYQAQHASPASEIVLLGDGMDALKGVTQISLAGLKNINAAKEFLKVYVHMSTNPEGYEKFCFLRWYYLLQYMQMYDVRSVFYFDSDVLIYSSVDEIARVYKDISCGYLVLQPFDELGCWASAHMSYWTIDMLERFCLFVLNCYRGGECFDVLKRKWAWHVQEKACGCIEDMTLLYLFWLKDRDNIINFADVSQGTVFDNNINCSRNYKEKEYVVRRGMKKLIFRNRRPFLIKREDHSLVKAHALHFQGHAKEFIPRYYRGGLFKGKLFSECHDVYIKLKKFIKWILGYKKPEAIHLPDHLA